MSGTGDSTEHVFDLQAGLPSVYSRREMTWFQPSWSLPRQEGIFFTSTSLVETSIHLKNWLPLTPMTPGLSYWRSMQAVIVGNST